jgi:hypothetical protein
MYDIVRNTSHFGLNFGCSSDDSRMLYARFLDRLCSNGHTRQCTDARVSSNNVGVTIWTLVLPLVLVYLDL